MASAMQDGQNDDYADDVPEPLRSESITARIVRDRIWKPPNRSNLWAAFTMVGREGSGKSHTTASLLQKVDPTFGPERVFFDPADLVGYISDIPEDERQGKAVMLDEAGVGMGVRTWHDSEQVKVNKAAQTMRDDNMIMGLTLPSFALLDSQLRTRMHGFCEMRGVQPGDYATWSWKDIVVNREEGGNTIRRKEFPRTRVGARKKRITRLTVGPPTDEFISAYEQAKKDFKDQLYAEVVGEGEDEDDGKRGPKDIANEIIDAGRIEDFVDEHGVTGMRYISKDKLQLEFDELSVRGSKQVKVLLENEWEENDE